MIFDMRRLLSALLIILPLSVSAQKKVQMELDFVATTNANFTENDFDGLSFKMDRLRMVIKGDINDKLSYYFRQSFNKNTSPLSVDKLPASLEYANITWRQSDFFQLVVGKQYVNYAGYECYLNALKVREFCDFNNSINIYHAGVTGIINPSPDHQLSLQVTNLRSKQDNEFYQYGLPDGLTPSKFPLLSTFLWSGWFADKAVHLMYSASAGQQAQGKNVYTLMGGHIYEKGPVIAYFDVMYSREGIDSQQRMTALQSGLTTPVTAQNTEYLSFVADFDYQFHPKWNAFVKGAYETAGIYKDNGHFTKGKYMTSWNAQVCLEWLPFTEDKGLKIFAHYVYHGYELTQKAQALNAVKPHSQRFSLGLVYVLPVLSR